MNKTNDVRDWLNTKLGAFHQIQKDVTTLTSEIKSEGKGLCQHEKALEVVKAVGLKTQQQLQFHISDITSLAMEAVLDNPYQLDVNFIERRNKIECDLTFTREGKEYNLDPLDSTGGGVVDVAAFALRIASWSLQRKTSVNTIILDEPMRFLSVDNQEKASLMIKELSDKLNLQFIIVTHELTLATHADKVFQVSIKKGVSKVFKKSLK